MILQILLGVVILSMTVIVAAAGIQFFLVLQDLRHAIKRVNAILQNTQTLSDASAKPIAAVNEFFTEVKTLVNDTQNEIIDSTPDRVIEQGSSLPYRSGRAARFFRRAGNSLRAN
jgi:hypothetical protein